MSGFSYYTIIGRDPLLFRYHVKNVIDNAGLPRDEWDFNVVIYYNHLISHETTQEILQICDDNDIRYVMHSENPNEPFISRLYKAWNLGYSLGKRDLVLRAGSDQTFSQNSFAMMMDYWNTMPWNDAILQFNTVEHHGPSRHFVRDFGKTFAEYDNVAFQEFVNKYSKHGLFDGHSALEAFGKPGPMIHGKIRPDGVSWLQKRKNFEKHGPMPPIVGGITGDVLIHDKYNAAGIPTYMMGDVWSYHMVKGESAGHGQ